MVRGGVKYPVKSPICQDGAESELHTLLDFPDHDITQGQHRETRKIIIGGVNGSWLEQTQIDILLMRSILKLWLYFSRGSGLKWVLGMVKLANDG